MATSFPANIRYIQSGDPVSASIANAASYELSARTNYLKAVIDALQAQQALIDYESTVESSALVGQVVYWNSTNLRYEKAIAATSENLETGTLSVAESSECTGMIISKSDSTTANILLFGLAEFSDLSNAIDGTIEPGRYYLSAAAAGKIVKQSPPVSVAIGIVYGPLDDCDTSSWVYFNPQAKAFLEEHIHYKYDLVCLPAGDIDHSEAETNGYYTIANDDTDVLGWLPADNAIFAGQAPTGAKFGYNISQDSALLANWPPVPLSGSVVFWDKGGSNGASEIPSSGDDALVILNNYGIWWMSDCVDSVPWPDTAPESPSSLGSESSAAPCPWNSPMRLMVAFLHMLLSNEKNAVTSLQPYDSTQPLQFYDIDGNVATTGNLYARLALDLLVDEEDATGGQVIKEITTDNKFNSGWVAEGIIAGSSDVILTSTHQRYLTPGDSSTDVVHQGIITLDVNDLLNNRILEPQIVRLSNAVERYYKDTTYIGLPSGQNSEFRMRFDIPFAGLPTSPKFKIKCLVLPMLTGTYPDISASYYRIVDPGTSYTTLTDTDTALTIDFNIAVVADRIRNIESSEISIAAGDTIFISIARETTDLPAYNQQLEI